MFTLYNNALSLVEGRLVLCPAQRVLVRESVNPFRTKKLEKLDFEIQKIHKL